MEVVLYFILLSLVLAGLLIYRENQSLALSHYQIKSKKISRSLKICQISDFHNHDNEGFQEKLYQAICQEDPDYIFLTGDLVDSRKTKPEVTLNFLKRLVVHYPCYYVTGNHEHRIKDLEKIHQAYRDLGIHILDNESLVLEEGLEIHGLQDPRSQGRGLSKQDMENYYRKLLDQESFDPRAYQVLLVHRPDFLSLFVSYPLDLVLAGHLHGGQIRLPILGPLLSPYGEFFPKGAQGMQKLKETRQITSRGLGNSSFPIRINNPPDLVVVSLEKEK